ncbi:unnamed protein product [Meloidogyne enterolobii]|uniref:Uncharacterized protein n=1 Tax=Meloidogyne enterolobii TaxID=390850 RepID=A0ACB0Z3M0_MELEN
MLNYFLLFIILFGLKDCSLQSEKNISSIPSNKLLTQKLFKEKSVIEEEEEEEEETFYDPKESFSNSLAISEEKEKEIEIFKEKLSNSLEISEEEKGGEEEEIENENDLLECKPSLLNKLFCLFVLISPCFASKCFVTPKGPPLNSLLKIQHIHRVEQPFFMNYLKTRQNSITNSKCEEEFRENKKIYKCKALIDKNEKYKIKLEKNGKNLFDGEIEPIKCKEKNICKKDTFKVKNLKKKNSQKKVWK